VLKALGAGATVSLAGCSGDGGDGGGDGSDGSDGSGDGGSDGGGDGGDGMDDGGTPTQGGDVDISGTEITWWDVMNAQGQTVKEALAALGERFENETGATLRINWSGYGPQYGQEWITQFNQGNRPIISTHENLGMGKFFAEGHYLPFSEYEDLLDDEVVENIQWMIPYAEEANRMWDAQLLDIPYGVDARTPFVARADHFEQAGLSVEDDFPPTDYEGLVQLAETLQSDGPTDVGYPVYGDGFDWCDTLDPWRAAASDEVDNYLDETGTEPLYREDGWIEWMERNVEFERQGLATDQSPSLSDERARDLLIAGDISMASIEFFNVPVMFQQAEQMMTDGTIVFGKPWGGETGNPGVHLIESIGLTSKPENMDDSTYERKKRAGAEFMNFIMSKEFQRQLPRLLGLWPVRRDVWSEVEIPGEENHHIAEGMQYLTENTALFQPTQVNAGAIVYDIPATHMQQVYRGEKSIEQAAEDMYRESLDVIP